MKYLSIIFLLVFVNFMALPSIATLFHLEIAKTNIVLSEEESQHSPLVINEKSLPKVLDISDFEPFFVDVFTKKSFFLFDDAVNLSAYLSIFSPPPEI